MLYVVHVRLYNCTVGAQHRESMKSSVLFYIQKFLRIEIKKYKYVSPVRLSNPGEREKGNPQRNSSRIRKRKEANMIEAVEQGETCTQIAIARGK